MSFFLDYLLSIYISLSLCCYRHLRALHSFPTRRSSDLGGGERPQVGAGLGGEGDDAVVDVGDVHDLLHLPALVLQRRSEEHTSELQSPCNLVCRLLLEKKN